MDRPPNSQNQGKDRPQQGGPRPSNSGSRPSNSSARPAPGELRQPKGKLLTYFKTGLTAQSELMDLAHEFAKELVTGKIPVKHHQLRLLLDIAIRLKQGHKESLDHPISTASLGRLSSMRPRLAYMAGRERGLLSLQIEMDHLLKDKTVFKTGADLDRLYEFVAAVVAYHRYEEANKIGH